MYQKITLIGNLGRDPETRYLPSGQSVCNFSVATSNKYTGKDGNLVEETLWWRVAVFGKMAETCQTYLKKGSKVYVEGRVTGDPRTGGPRVFQRQDGTNGSSFEVNASTVKFLSSRGEGGGGGAPSAGAPAEAYHPGEESDEIPF